MIFSESYVGERTNVFAAYLKNSVTRVVEPFTVEIAEQVEVTLNVNEGKTIIHLNNMSGARKQNFGTYLPIDGGRIKINKAGSFKARARWADKELEVKDGEGAIPTLEQFEVVVIEAI